MVFPVVDDEQDVVQTLSLAFFGRAADPETREFLTEFVDLDNPDAVAALADSFVASPEFQGSFAAASPDALVRSVFFNLFDRAPDVQEQGRWTKRLENGKVDEAELPGAVLGRASEADLEAFEAKLFIAEYVTDQTELGGWVPDTLTFPDLRSNAELYADLNALAAQSDDLSLRQIGESLEGNPLYAATIGTGRKHLMFLTQQHGNEPIGTESAMYLLDFLAGGSEEAARLLRKVTVTVVPRLNPDGADRLEDALGGQPGLLSPRVNSNGIDLNRTYDPADPFSAVEAPESAALRALVAELDPTLLFDFHGQGNYRDDEGDLDTMSVLWPTNPGVSARVEDIAKRAVAVIAESVEAYDYGQVTLYPGSTDPRIARNGFSIDGTPTVLVEQRFSQELSELTQGLDLDYSALVSALTLEGFIAMKGLVEAAANKRLKTIDPALAEEIPERSPSISFDDLYSDDRYVGETLIA
jgi:hypothetical protein